MSYDHQKVDAFVGEAMELSPETQWYLLHQIQRQWAVLDCGRFQDLADRFDRLGYAEQANVLFRLADQAAEAIRKHASKLAAKARAADEM